jgi:phage terminase large subunit-like protein
VIWGSSKEELQRKYHESLPKSFTFIPSSIYDNKILLESDPDYLANLDALLDYEQKRLKGGNWFARPAAGEIFRRDFFQVIEENEVPPAIAEVRFWDRAATTPSEASPDPDWSAGVKMRKGSDGIYYLMHVEHFRGEPYDVQTYPETKKKLAYWKPLAAQAKAGNVKVVRGAWNESFFRELEGVTDGSLSGHDDQADAAAGAFLLLSDGSCTPLHVPSIDRGELVGIGL